MKDLSYKNYSKARDASWRILADNNITSLPVDVSGLAQNMGIKVVPYSKGNTLMKLLGVAKLKNKNDGLYVRFLGKSYIFYDDSVTSEGRIRFTIAHELGHHSLKHIRLDMLFIPRCAQRRRGAASNAREREANIFAARLLAPSIVLHELNLKTEEEIATVCGMSKEAAQYRLNRLKELDARGRYSMSGLEKRVLDNFRDFIEKNRITK